MQSMDGKKYSDGWEMVDKTLRKVALGGIHDHIAGGFHRYSVDSKWHTPHFEKMLYDQASLASVFADAHSIHPTAYAKYAVDSIIRYVREV
jgi:uncharacterized protein